VKQGCQKYKLNLLASNNSIYFPMSVAELPSIFLEQWCAGIHKYSAWAQSLNLRDLQCIGRRDLYRVSQEEMSIFWQVIVSAILSKRVYLYLSYSEWFPR
jgi:hypothetical protein